MHSQPHSINTGQTELLRALTHLFTVAVRPGALMGRPCELAKDALYAAPSLDCLIHKVFALEMPAEAEKVVHLSRGGNEPGEADA
jgi:hypothetical protein